MEEVKNIKNKIESLTYKEYRKLPGLIDDLHRHVRDFYETSPIFKSVYSNTVKESQTLRNKSIASLSPDFKSQTILKNFYKYKKKALLLSLRIINQINNKMINEVIHND